MRQVSTAGAPPPWSRNIRVGSVVARRRSSRVRRRRTGQGGTTVDPVSVAGVARRTTRRAVVGERR